MQIWETSFGGPRTIERSRLGVSNAPNFGRRGGNSSIPKSRAKDSEFLGVGGISMLCLLCLLYLLESYALLALLALLTRIQRLFASVCRFTWHKASEDEPGDGDRGLVSPMRLTSGDEEATLPFPNRELRTRNFRRRRISMLCLLCLLTY